MGDRARIRLRHHRVFMVTQRRFGEVDAAFAFDEGEGDRSLDHWRAAHQRYFTRLKLYQPDMMLWCERFELVMTIPEQKARL